MVVAFEVVIHRLNQVLLDGGALRGQRVDLLLVDSPGHSEDEQAHLHGVVLAQDGVHLRILAEEDDQEDVDQFVELHDVQQVEVLVDEEQFHFHEQHRLLQRLDQDVDDGLVDVRNLEVPQVDLHGDLEGAVAEADGEQLEVVGVLDGELDLQEVVHEVVLAVHLKHLLNFAFAVQETVSKVEGDSAVDQVLDDDLFVVRL
mmetsp:Transcript_22642/g.34932  ORF Transcript_22642/g.34932 Transcript_22642/m.34932 type:complete len:201 (+) Transcript_22642:2663-3265(+)